MCEGKIPVEVQLARLEERLHGETHLLAREIEGVKAARDLIAVEYKDHFLRLNNENGRIEAAQSKSVSRESCSGQHEAIRLQLDTIEKWKAGQEGKASQKDVNTATMIAWGSILLSIASLISRFF